MKIKALLYIYPTAIFFLSAASGCQKHSNDGHYDESWKHFGHDEERRARDAQEKATISAAENEESGTLEENLTIPPDRVVFKSQFLGSMLPSSLSVVYEPPVSSEASETPVEKVSFYSSIKPTIDKMLQKPIRLLAEQTYGNNQSSLFTQTVTAEIDNVQAEGEKPVMLGDSASGVQQYNRINGENPNCPPFFVCIDRMSIVPKKGTAKTFCFLNKDTMEFTAIPVGSGPGTSYSDVLEHQGRFGPFMVRRYDAANVDCRNTVLDFVYETEILVDVRVETRQDRLQKINEGLLDDEPRAGFAVVFDVIRRNGGKAVSHLTKPFIDTLTGLQSRTIYYLSDTGGSLVRIVKTLRRPMNIPIQGFSIPFYTGFTVDVEFKFCKDLLIPSSKAFCN